MLYRLLVYCTFAKYAKATARHTTKEILLSNGCTLNQKGLPSGARGVVVNLNVVIFPMIFVSLV